MKKLRLCTTLDQSHKILLKYIYIYISSSSRITSGTLFNFIELLYAVVESITGLYIDRAKSTLSVASGKLLRTVNQHRHSRIRPEGHLTITASLLIPFHPDENVLRQCMQ